MIPDSGGYINVLLWPGLSARRLRPVLHPVLELMLA
jgi:hypothetical protein